MRIAIADDSRGSNAHTYIRAGLAKAFAGSGHDCVIWDIYAKPALDFFEEFSPDIFIGQTYNLERGIMKALVKYQPKVILTGGDWSKFADDIDIVKFPIVRANEKEIKNVSSLISDVNIDGIICHYHNSKIGITHEYWKEKLGINIYGVPPAADIADYTNGKKYDFLESDVCLVGGKWSYKGQTIDSWFLPLCGKDSKLNIKIFGNRSWGIPQYCGNISNVWVRHAFKSAKVCPNISEPHAQVYGIELNERCFKLLSNKCPCVSDYTESLATDVFFNGEIEFAKTPAEYRQKIEAVVNGDLIIDVERGYNTVMSNHTYFHRVAQIFQILGLEKESKNTLDIYQQIREGNNL